MGNSIAKVVFMLVLLLCLTGGNRQPYYMTGGSGSGSGCVETWSLNTSTDAISTEWTPAGVIDQTNCPWSIGASLLTWDSNHASNCDNKDMFIAMRNLDVGTVNQWACTIADSRGGTQVNPGIIFRGLTDDTTTSWTQIKFIVGGATVFWGEDGGSSIANCTIDAVYALGEKFCAHIYGTGSNTRVDFWVDPVGATPDDWGTEECNVQGTETNSPGNFMGVMVRTVTPSTSAFVSYSQANGGTCT